MSELQDIVVQVESVGDSPVEHGNATPILHEILHALQHLQKTGESTTIDLRSLPFGPGDEERLLGVLGRGEVDIHLDALGDSEIWESSFAGVWVIDHKNTEGEPIALQIEITRMPRILYSQTAEVETSISRLDNQLNAAAAEISLQATVDQGRRDG